jgi:energy-coupling factor transporter ATP-binding protein EcfA2
MVHRRNTGARAITLECLSFDVPKGRIFPLLGTNGAGKSTTVKVLATCIKPTSVSFRIFGNTSFGQSHSNDPHRAGVRDEGALSLGALAKAPLGADVICMPSAPFFRSCVESIVAWKDAPGGSRAGRASGPLAPLRRCFLKNVGSTGPRF